MKTLTLRRRANDWHCHINDNEALWGCGKTPGEAIGETVRNHPAILGLVIKLEGEQALHPVSVKIISAINVALKQFGSYTYHDKGASEVMDIPELVREIKTLTFDEILQVIAEVEREADAAPALQAIVGSMDDWQDPKTEALFTNDAFIKWY